MGRNSGKKPANKSRIVANIMFVIGALVLIYPLISRTFYDYRGNEEISSYETSLAQLTTKETEERLQLAYAYNSALLSGDSVPLGDPYSEEEKAEGLAEYARMLEINEKIGVLTIPKIQMEFPIYAGTNEAVLQKGVGHLEGSSLPIGGLNTNAVLTAHRGLPENKLFTDLDKMAEGDLFFVKTLAGEMAYQVIKTKVIEPTDIEQLAIQQDQDLITLLTCTPYMVNSHRLLVIGERTELPAEDTQQAAEISPWQHYLSLFGEYKYVILVILLLIGYSIGKRLIKGRKKGLDEKGSKGD